MSGKRIRAELLMHLSVHEWKNGQELREAIEKKTDEEVHQPQVYGSLVKLEAAGLIESKVEHEGTKQQRRLYRKKVSGKKTRRPFSIRGFFGFLPQHA